MITFYYFIIYENVDRNSVIADIIVNKWI